MLHSLYSLELSFMLEKRKCTLEKKTSLRVLRDCIPSVRLRRPGHPLRWHWLVEEG